MLDDDTNVHGVAVLLCDNSIARPGQSLNMRSRIVNGSGSMTYVRKWSMILGADHIKL
jgi:hypothetical protein